MRVLCSTLGVLLVQLTHQVQLFTLFDWRLAALLHLLLPVLMAVVIFFRRFLYQAFARTRETLGSVTEMPLGASVAES